MGVTKWITGVLGWAYFGPLGGLIGFLLGSAIEQYIDASHQLPGGDAPKGGTRTYSATQQRNSFFVSLLVLSSAVMKADGKIHPAELDCVRAFFRRNFGDDAATLPLSGPDCHVRRHLLQIGEKCAGGYWNRDSARRFGCQFRNSHVLSGCGIGLCGAGDFAHRQQ